VTVFRRASLCSAMSGALAKAVGEYQGRHQTIHHDSAVEFAILTLETALAAYTARPTPVVYWQLEALVGACEILQQYVASRRLTATVRGVPTTAVQAVPPARLSRAPADKWGMSQLCGPKGHGLSDHGARFAMGELAEVHSPSTASESERQSQVAPSAREGSSPSTVLDGSLAKPSGLGVGAMGRMSLPMGAVEPRVLGSTATAWLGLSCESAQRVLRSLEGWWRDEGDAQCTYWVQGGLCSRFLAGVVSPGGRFQLRWDPHLGTVVRGEGRRLGVSRFSSSEVRWAWCQGRDACEEVAVWVRLE